MQGLAAKEKFTETHKRTEGLCASANTLLDWSVARIVSH
jgi:hypothetical protein